MKPQEKEEIHAYDMGEIMDLIKKLKLSQKEVIRRLMNDSPPQPPMLDDNDLKNINKHMLGLNMNKGHIMALLKVPTFNNNTSINNFGSENMERVTHEYLESCVKSKDGLQRLAKFIHFNKDYPKDMNVRRGSITQKTLKIMENGSWVRADRNTVLDKMIKYMLDMMIQYFFEFHHEMPQAFIDEFAKWYKSTRSKSSRDYFNIRNELNMCAMNID
jgi:hypothetical protein